MDESGSGEDESGGSGSDDGSTEEESVEDESGDDVDGEIFKLTGFIFQCHELKLLPISPRQKQKYQ